MDSRLFLIPFARCATTLISPEKLNRQWVGIEIWTGLKDVVVSRLEQAGLIAPKYTRNRSKVLSASCGWMSSMLRSNILNERTREKTDVDDLEPVVSFKNEPWE